MIIVAGKLTSSVIPFIVSLPFTIYFDPLACTTAVLTKAASGYLTELKNVSPFKVVTNLSFEYLSIRSASVMERISICRLTSIAVSSACGCRYYCSNRANASSYPPFYLFAFKEITGIRRSQEERSGSVCNASLLNPLSFNKNKDSNHLLLIIFSQKAFLYSGYSTFFSRIYQSSISTYQRFKFIN